MVFYLKFEFSKTKGSSPVPSNLHFIKLSKWIPQKFLSDIFCCFYPNYYPNYFFSDMKEGAVGDMGKLGITESLSVKRQVLVSASEAAEMILRVDDIIKAAPRKRQADHHPC